MRKFGNFRALLFLTKIITCLDAFVPGSSIIVDLGYKFTKRMNGWKSAGVRGGGSCSPKPKF